MVGAFGVVVVADGVVEGGAAFAVVTKLGNRSRAKSFKTLSAGGKVGRVPKVAGGGGVVNGASVVVDFVLGDGGARRASAGR